jgi:Lipopolysaccharide-assembly
MAKNHIYLLLAFRSRILLACSFFLITLSGPSCKIYRFTDTSVNPDIKTFSVMPTVNVATLQNPIAASYFTDKLKDKFIRDTRLVLKRDYGDVEFACVITEYNIVPVSVINTETLAQNRLNISIRLEFTNRTDPKKNFSQSFRDGENFDANSQFASIENQLLNTIYDRIIQQVFVKAFSNW